MKFRSAIDGWYYLLAIGLPFVLVLMFIFLQAIVGMVVVWAIVLAFLLAGFLPIWVLVSTSYRIEGGMLLIRSGPRQWAIPLEDIHSVHAVRTSRGAPALSLNRLELRYSLDRVIHVSPRDRDAFLAAIGKSLASQDDS